MSSYGALCTEFYDLDKPAAPPQALDFYIEEARKAGGRTLEPMCGSGRFLLPMARSGLLVDGVDSSSAMLAACRKRAVALGLSLTVYQQDIQSLVLPHRYAMTFVASGSIGFVASVEGLRNALSCLHAHMERDATLFLELVTVDEDACGGSGELEPRVVHCADGSTITYSCLATPSPQREAILYEGTYEKRHGARVIETETEQLILRSWSTAEMVSELMTCGFRTPKVWGPSDAPFLQASGCSLIQARV